ncbi:glycosyltransferase family 2 protein [bacterium]|nr:glycosyltransferase family 2 protein [bacterium]MBU1024742.1 glycosyltransferase family 2 protein [bacterium]
MSCKLVSIILLTWNAKPFLSDCFDSISSQDYPNLELIVVDNGSEDGTADNLRSSLEHKIKIDWKLELLPENTGFACGMNHGIALSSGDYIFTLNQDLVMNPDFISKLVSEIESKRDRPVASVTGKILKWNIDTINGNSIIDSTGHVIFDDRIVEGRGKNEPADRYNEPSEVFGVSAAASLYSKKALETVSVGNEFFDNDFFSYLEDIDLDYRLLFRGFESRYVPDAVAKHAGGGSGGRKSFLIRFKAHTNRYLVWIKNEERSGLMKDFFPIALQECLQLVRTLFTSPLLLLSWFYFPTKAIRVAKKGRSVYADGKEYGRLDDFKLKGRLFRKIA